MPESESLAWLLTGGLVAAFTSWNFPAALIVRKVAPAIAAGCSVIVRPSSQTPGTAIIIFDCLRADGLPEGDVNLVTGSARVGQQMTRDGANTVKKCLWSLGATHP